MTKIEKNHFKKFQPAALMLCSNFMRIGYRKFKYIFNFPNGKDEDGHTKQL